MMYRAFVIDDNESNIEALEQLLLMEGFQVYTASSAHDISSKLAGIEPIDIAFLDLEFPNHSGLDLISELKKHEYLRNAIFVAYSVHISELNEAMMAGFQGFIGKPLDVDSFPSQIQRIMRGEQVWETNQ